MSYRLLQQTLPFWLLFKIQISSLTKKDVYKRQHLYCILWAPSPDFVWTYQTPLLWCFKEFNWKCNIHFTFKNCIMVLIITEVYKSNCKLKNGIYFTNVWFHICSTHYRFLNTHLLNTIIHIIKKELEYLFRICMKRKNVTFFLKI